MMLWHSNLLLGKALGQFLSYFLTLKMQETEAQRNGNDSAKSTGYFI